MNRGEPPDLGPYLDPPLGDADVRRHLEGGKRRLARHRRRRMTAGAVALLMTGSAAAALLPRWFPREARDLPGEHAGRRDGPSAPSVRPPALQPAAPTGDAFTAVPARPSDALADSVGIHVRLWYAAYSGGNYRFVKRRLEELGVRHLYDVYDASKTRLDRLRDLGDRGARLHILLRQDGDPEAVARALGPTLASVQTDWRFGEEYRQGLLDAAWAEKARAFARSTHERVRRSPHFADVALLGPSVRPPYEAELVGDLSAFADAGALNYWPAPGFPGARLDEELQWQRRVFPGKPLVITQSGYTTAALALVRVSEAVQSRYLLRLHLEAFDRGIVRTFANQLVDFSNDTSSIDSGLGLLHQNGVPKPSFFALKSFLGAVADPGAPHPPAVLPFALDCAEPDLRRLLLVRRDGSFLLAVWLARPSEEQEVRRPARLRLKAPARRIRLLDPHGSRPVVQVDDATELSFEVSDAVGIIELAP